MPPATRWLLPLLLIVASAGAGWQPCAAQVADLLQTPATQRVVRVNHFYTWVAGDSLSRVKATDSLYQLAKEKGDDHLAFYVRLIAANRNDLEKSGPLAETIVAKDSADFENAPFIDVKAAFHLYAALVYDRRQNYESMFYHLITAINLFEKTGWDKVPLAATFANHIFRIYYNFGDYHSALKYLQVAMAHADLLQWSSIFTLNNMGVTYLKLKDFEKAKEAFSEVIAQAKRDGNPDYLGIGSGNYGNALRLQGRYREALPYLYTDVALNEKTVAENAAITCAYIADCLLQLDSVVKAGFYLQKASALRFEWNWASFQPPYYQATALYFQKQGNFRLASLYQDSLVRVKDSLREKYNTSLLLTTSLTLKEERRLAEQRQKDLEADQLRLVRNVTVGGLVLLFSVVLLAVLRKRRQERERLLAKQQEAEAKLHRAEAELAQYLTTIKEKSRLLEQVEARLSATDGPVSSGDNAEAGTEAPLQEITFSGLQLLTEADWRQFTTFFTAVYPQFFSGLEQQYPGLSLNDQRLLALLKLQLSSREMAGMLGISLDSLRKSRYRLRKKHPQLLEDSQLKDLL